MKATVPIDQIVGNPFQARKKVDGESIRALAEEIRAFGLWPGALRGRLKNGKVELCYGHRRLAALKQLGWREVEVDIVDLSDEEMALQSLAENLQRVGLSDLEKADAIQLMIKKLVQKGSTEQDALHRVCRLVGLSEAWIKDLLSMRDLEPGVQKAIREKKIAGRTALEAHRLGGAQMVKTAAKKGLAVHAISKLSQKLRQVPDAEVREKLRVQVSKGRLTQPGELDAMARKLLKGRKIKPPENLEKLVGEWLAWFEEAEAKADAMLALRKHLKAGDGATVKFRVAVTRLIKKLEKLT
jgi:ParB/RepB/Spo0J family partition protein